MQGKRFGQLVVVSEAEKRSGKRRWNCLCDCGNSCVVWQDSLNRAGPNRSCGCAVSEFRRRRWEDFREPAFWARVNRASKNKCWEWTGLVAQGPKNPTPYGVLGWNGKHARAHRVAYELANGPIPAGFMVLHRCDNTLCCNPSHLYLGNHDQNMQDMVDRQRRAGIGAGEQNGRAKLTQEQADAIRSTYEAGSVSQQALADQYGVSQFAISMIIRRKRYVNDIR